MWYMSALEPLFIKTDNPHLARRFASTVFYCTRNTIYRDEQHPEEEIGIESFLGIIDNSYTLVQQVGHQLSTRFFCEVLLAATMIYTKMEIEDVNITFSEFLELTRYQAFWLGLFQGSSYEKGGLRINEVIAYLNQLERDFLNIIDYDVISSQARLDRLAPILSQLDVYPAFKDEITRLEILAIQQQARPNYKHLSIELQEFFFDAIGDISHINQNNEEDPEQFFKDFINKLEQLNQTLQAQGNVTHGLSQDKTDENKTVDPSNPSAAAAAIDKPAIQWAKVRAFPQQIQGPVAQSNSQDEDRKENRLANLAPYEQTPSSKTANFNKDIQIADIETVMLSPRAQTPAARLADILECFFEVHQSSCCVRFFSKKDNDLCLARICHNLLKINTSQQSAKALTLVIAYSKCNKLAAHLVNSLGHKNPQDCINRMMQNDPLSKKQLIADSAGRFLKQVLTTTKASQVGALPIDHLSTLINAINQPVRLELMLESAEDSLTLF